jgi:hypothetical protein
MLKASIPSEVQLDHWLSVLSAVDSQSMSVQSESDYARTQREYEGFVQSLSSSVPAWPVQPVFLRLFLVYKFFRNGRSAKSLANYQTHIKRGNLLREYDWLNEYQRKAVGVTMHALAKMAKDKTICRKTPLTIVRLRYVLRDQDPRRPRELELITISWTTHNALLRSGESVRLCIGSITWSRDRKSFKITLLDSKMNQVGAPEVIELVCWEDDSSAVYWMKRYYDANNLWDAPASQPLFPSFQRRETFVSAIQLLVRSSGLPGDYAGHSFRSGGACDLWGQNVPIQAIMLRGRWRSDCVMLYLRDEEVTAVKVAQAFKLASEHGFAFWGQDSTRGA